MGSEMCIRDRPRAIRPSGGGEGRPRWASMSERFSLAWVLCGDISRSSSTVVSLCGPHSASVSVSFSVQPFPVDRSPLLLWPLLALLELPCRPSIHLRPVLPLLLVVARRRHFPSGVRHCSPRGPGPVRCPPGVSASIQLGRCVGSRPDPSSGAGPVYVTKCRSRVAGLAAVGGGCDVFGLLTLCM